MQTTKIRLTQVQSEVITKMREGWGLAKSRYAKPVYCWLQKDGIGHGGPTQKVNMITHKTLAKYGIIEFSGTLSSSASEFMLTQLGREIDINS